MWLVAAALRRSPGSAIMWLAARLLGPFLVGFVSCALLLRNRQKSAAAGKSNDGRARAEGESADSHPMAYLNCIIGVLWPHVTAFVREEIVRKQVERLSLSLSLSCTSW